MADIFKKNILRLVSNNDLNNYFYCGHSRSSNRIKWLSKRTRTYLKRKLLKEVA